MMLATARAPVRAAALRAAAPAGASTLAAAMPGGAAARGMATADGYLRSKRDFLPTMKFQASLPRLPVPELSSTLDKYLRYTEPLVPEAQMASTRAIVEDFRKTGGPALQSELEIWDAGHTHTSFISPLWYDMYLENRDPFPLFLSPQLTWKDDPEPAKMTQAARAANLVGASARFFRSLRDGNLAPDIFHTKSNSQNMYWEYGIGQFVPEAVAFYAAYAFGAYPLDMSQYHNQFCSTRMPLRGKDELVKHADTDYVAVMRGSKVYKVQVLGADNLPLDEATIEASLAAILADDPAPGEPSVGALTSLNRDTWADLRPVVERASSENRASLAAIDKALFVLTLEDEAPSTPAALSRCMLHGNCRNRWFDKSFNLIVTANGKAGVNWEHAWGDGVSMLRYFNEVYDENNAEPARPAASPATGEAAPKALPFRHTAQAVSGIREAEAAADALVASAELEIFETDALTKKDLKAQSLSPDGTMQMVLQLAHQRMHGYTASTYESASTAAFKHGRTETIRSATPQARAFALAFCDDKVGPVERLAKLRDAVDFHSTVTRDAMTGKGIDRHLFALRKFAERKGASHDIFTDPTYATFTDIRLSTSTLASPALDGGGFGPISPRAYSVGYGIEERGSRFHVMTNGLGTKEFVGHVEQALRDIHAVIYNK